MDLKILSLEPGWPTGASTLKGPRGASEAKVRSPDWAEGQGGLGGGGGQWPSGPDHLDLQGKAQSPAEAQPEMSQRRGWGGAPRDWPSSASSSP